MLLTIGLLHSTTGTFGPGEWLSLGLRQVAGGVLIGLLVGRLGAWALRTTRLHDSAQSPVLALSLAGVAYGLAAVAGGSGFLAVYLAGVAIGTEVKQRRAVETFHAGLAGTAQIGLFLMLGLLVFPSQLPGVAAKAVVIAATLAFVARPLAVLVCLSPFGFARRERIVASWPVSGGPSRSCWPPSR